MSLAAEPLQYVRFVLLEVLGDAVESRFHREVVAECRDPLVPLVILHCIQAGDESGMPGRELVAHGLWRRAARADAGDENRLGRAGSCWVGHGWSLLPRCA